MLVKNYSVVGVHMGAYREMDPAVLDECFAEVYPMMADGRLEPLVSQTVGFEDLLLVLTYWSSTTMVRTWSTH